MVISAKALEEAIGRVAIVQMDNRYCTTSRDWKASIPILRAAWFWWKSAQINAVWASAHGYGHFIVCIPSCQQCVGGSLIARKTSWCKLKAVAAILREGRHDTILFLDSDAYITDTGSSLPEMLLRFTWTGDWWPADAGGHSGRSTAASSANTSTNATLPSLFFACNHPFTLGWPSHPRGSSSLPASLERQLLRRGPPNSGIWLARRGPSTLRALRAWWHARDDAAAARWQPPQRSWPWHTRWQEQGALWDLMLSNDSSFMEHARVLATPARGREGGSGKESHSCLRAIGSTHSAGSASASSSSGSSSSSSPARHLDHHHFKQASQRSMVMQLDLEAAVGALKSQAMLHDLARDGESESRGAARAAGGLAGGTSAGFADGSARHSHGQHSSGCRTHLLTLSPTDPSFDGGCAVTTSTQQHEARASCADALLANVPPCRRPLKADACSTGTDAASLKISRNGLPTARRSDARAQDRGR